MAIYYPYLDPVNRHGAVAGYFSINKEVFSHVFKKRTCRRIGLCNIKSHRRAEELLKEFAGNCKTDSL